jgi:uncharacterized delta-60 repeat protein
MKKLSRHAAFAAFSLVTLMPPAVLAADDAGELCSNAAVGVATDRDGRTLVVGSAYDNRILEWESGHAHYGDLAISRLLENGAVDDTFAEQGTLLLDVGDFDTLTDVIVRREGIYSGGTTAPTADDRSGESDLVVLALTETGRRRRGFGARGVLTLDLGGDDELAGLAADPNGTLYVAGTSSAGGESDGFVLRLTRHGELDTAFGDGGIVWLDTGSSADRVLSIQVSARGVSVGGQTLVDDEAAALAARLDHDGRWSRRFGDAGIATQVVGGALDAVGVAFHGRYGTTAVVLPRSTPSGDVEAVTAVFDADGRNAGTGGASEVQITTLPRGASFTSGGFWWGGSLYLSGAIYNDDFSLGDAFLGRAVPGGELDGEFAGGPVTQHLVLEYAAYYDLSVSRDGVTVAGWEFSESAGSLAASDALVARYGHDGILDESFGDSGVVLLDFRGGQRVCGPAVFIE